MVNCNPSQTPVDTESKLDLSYAVQQICLYMHDLREPHSAALKRYCVFLGDNLLSWSAKRQHTLSRSSAEAEYWGVANVVAETAWLRNLLCELYSLLSTVTLVYCDNVNVVYMSVNPVQHQRTKHIKIDIHFIRDMIPLVRLEFYMCPLISNMPIFSPRGCLPHCLKNFDPV
ncbi:ribonuclease H-like domain-containing protein [Tanacetum coccineum]